jgi:hypothetical protein
MGFGVPMVARVAGQEVGDALFVERDDDVRTFRILARAALATHGSAGGTERIDFVWTVDGISLRNHSGGMGAAGVQGIREACGTVRHKTSSLGKAKSIPQGLKPRLLPKIHVRASAPTPMPTTFSWQTLLPALQEGALFEVAEGIAKLILGVHHDRTIPGDGFLERLAGDKQETDAVVAGLHHEFVAAIE